MRFLLGFAFVGVVCVACSTSSPASLVAKVPTEHRSTAVTCAPGAAQPEPSPTSTTGGPAMNCAKNADCTQGKNGTCLGDIVGGAHCIYDACTTDADCGAGKSCACNGTVGVRNACVPSDCATDKDCGTGYCSPARSCGSVIGVYCHRPADACTTDADCMGDAGATQYDKCLYQSGWICTEDRCPG